MPASLLIGRRLLAATVATAVVAASCNHSPAPPSGPGPGRTGPTVPPSSTGQGQPLVQKPPKGLDLAISEGRQGPPAVDHAKLAAATKLDEKISQALLARTPPIAAEPDDQQPFALRPATLPPPRTGATIKTAFPPPGAGNNAAPAAPTGPLHVVRWAPDGKVPLVPRLSVTFDQPMIAVTSQDAAAAIHPVELAPQPKGQWRWIGTRTLVFDADVRFPAATTYHVTVPTGTRSATGGALAKPLAFTFETPAPTLAASYPSAGTPARLDPAMFALFDQRVDPAAVLAHVRVTAAGKTYAVRALAADELAAERTRDPDFAAQLDAAQHDEHDGRWIAFRATDAFPTDTAVAVEIAAGTPSAEGPNATPAAQPFAFRTYARFAQKMAECGECKAGDSITLGFTNPLGDANDIDKLIAIAPAIPGASISSYGDRVFITGATRAHTTYRVTVSRALVDRFGQTLGADQTRELAIGDARPALFGPSGMVVLDPAAAAPTLDVFTSTFQSLDVQLLHVTPADYGDYLHYLREQWDHTKLHKLPGTLALRRTIAIANAGELAETHVDLRAALGGAATGDLVAIVTPAPWHESGEPPRLIAWLQATKLAVDAHVDNLQLVAFASELGTGKALAGVDVMLAPYNIHATTDAHGIARLPLVARRPGADYLVATRGGDQAFLGDADWNGNGSWFAQPAGAALRAYVTDDRMLYKPGEQVHLKGWLRKVAIGPRGDLEPPHVDGVAYVVKDAAGAQIAKGAAKVSAAGGFDTAFALPKTPRLGYAYVYFTAGGEHFQHGFQIEEFRRPEFEVAATASQGPFIVGAGDAIAKSAADLTTSATYFSGGPLAGADATWRVHAAPTTFTPPNRDDYSFGRWHPWWEPGDGDDSSAARAWSLAGKTDATGRHIAHLEFKSVDPPEPMSVVADATVMDVNRQAWNASAVLLVHPSERYVGLRAATSFVQKDTPFDVDVIGVDLDGKATPGAGIDLTAERLAWKWEHGQVKTERVERQTCHVAAAQAAVACHFATPIGGEYEITATIADAQGRPNQSTLSFWVAGGETPPSRDVSEERVPLVPDKKAYAPGDTAHVLVQTPFYPAEGVIAWERDGILKLEPLALTGPSTTIDVPIADAMTPNIHVAVELVGAAARLDDKGRPDPKLAKRPAFASGDLNLPVPPVGRKLAVTATPAVAKLAPGETTTIDVRVLDHAGKPVANAETAVIVVDEAVLALAGGKFEDPLAAFYTERGGGVSRQLIRGFVALASPDQTRVAANGAGSTAVTDATATPPAKTEGTTTAPPPPPALPGAPVPADQPAEEKPMDKNLESAGGKNGKGGGTGAGGGAPIALRTNFDALAAFAPAVMTGADGTARVTVRVPDNLTRYRVVALAAAGDKQFGKGESALVARLPLMIRPSPPRFLNYGDTFRLPIVVQNQTDAPMTVRLAARATNAALTDGAGREVTVPANDRVEVQLPAAAERAGIARFQIVGTQVGGVGAGNASDAAEVALPVWTPATTEGFATYGVIDRGAETQPLALPPGVVPQFGGVEVTAASTNLQSLTDALLYLVHYPFECAEQRASRVVAIAALRDVLDAFHTKDMPSRAKLEASVADDVKHLENMQNYDGGFAYWDRGAPSEPYLSVYVTNALARAKAKGFAIPGEILRQAGEYLRTIDEHIPAFYTPEVRYAIDAYALYTRKLLGTADIAAGKQLYARAGAPEKVSLETDGWLLALFAGDASAATERAALVRYALNRASETAGAANFTTGYGDGKYLLLASDRRVDGVMLDALIAAEPASDLIPKLVTGLLGHRTAGRWGSTQENAFALVALDRYFQTYEKVTPDFVARIWLGADYAGDHAFKGRQTDRYEASIPLAQLATPGHGSLTLQKDGQGRMYYRIGMTYAPASLALAPADRGFVVERRYEAVDDPADVRREPDGTWHVKAGARVRVRLAMVNDDRRYHVALVDPLPAGFEAMNPALAATGPVPQDPKQQHAQPYWWWQSTWYEHQNLRDERVEAFAELVWEGVHDYSYVARATTPGRFVVPPPKAEEMYSPETFGRGASDKVVVE